MLLRREKWQKQNQSWHFAWRKVQLFRETCPSHTCRRQGHTHWCPNTAPETSSTYWKFTFLSVISELVQNTSCSLFLASHEYKPKIKMKNNSPQHIHLKALVFPPLHLPPSKHLFFFYLLLPRYIHAFECYMLSEHRAFKTSSRELLYEMMWIYILIMPGTRLE